MTHCMLFAPPFFDNLSGGQWLSAPLVAFWLFPFSTSASFQPFAACPLSFCARPIGALCPHLFLMHSLRYLVAFWLCHILLVVPNQMSAFPYSLVHLFPQPFVAFPPNSFLTS